MVYRDVPVAYILVHTVESHRHQSFLSTDFQFKIQRFCRFVVADIMVMLIVSFGSYYSHECSQICVWVEYSRHCFIINDIELKFSRGLSKGSLHCKMIISGETGCFLCKYNWVAEKLMVKDKNNIVSNEWLEKWLWDTGTRKIYEEKAVMI